MVIVQFNNTGSQTNHIIQYKIENNSAVVIWFRIHCILMLLLFEGYVYAFCSFMMTDLAWPLHNHCLLLTRLWGSNVYIQVPPTVSSSDVLDLSLFVCFLRKINGHFHASSLKRWGHIEHKPF